MSHIRTIGTSPRNIRIANAIFFFISGFSYSAWAARIPTIKHNLHLNEAQLGAILFALPVGLMLTMPLTNYLLGKYSSRAIMLLGALSFNLMLCFVGFAAAPWQLVIILFGFGSARNLFNLSTNAQAVSVQKLYDKSIITTFHGIWSIAGFAGAALGYIMVSFNVATNWHLPIVGVSMMALSLFAFSNTLYEPVVKIQERKPVFSLPDKFLIKFSVIAFVSMACENTMYDWSGIYFEKAVHSSKPTATAAFVFYMVAMTSGRFLGDKLVSRIGIKRILFYSGILISTGLLIAVLLPYTVPAIIGFIFTGLGVSCIVPLIYSLASKSTSMSSARALASISTISYLGFLIVPPMVGFIAEAAGIRFSFAVIAMMGSIVIWMVSKIKEGE
ncbi:MFS transporter [Mucilaginibacter jinjuensis]|uniref:MFS transporter n=1 Tax=Mucilaginibacter jinjuensis TaxID=1176721 RepID=A0ABY7T156_9SPHI|nr:MFS transporter [Mucilaginibacter jinjuensis]WCT10160.1 MFS transporter [Mucilaginibacter jinjuensis]